ncbi:VOC family protein [Streptomyces sp. NPDC020667]|uniref:VOC family protein n=1 Tax=Streptomyces sp. NPDC020667 TaxID=3154895 RepID=UPI0033FD4C07
MEQPRHGTPHHLELWLPDLARAERSLGWLLETLGYEPYQSWEHGRSWRLGSFYIAVEQSPALTTRTHDRHRPGLNHLAFHAENRTTVETLTEAAKKQGWHLMYADRHPYAGGEKHYAAFLENDDGFEVELVAQE